MHVIKRNSERSIVLIKAIVNISKQNPRTWVSLVNICLLYYMKKRGNLPVTRPTHRGSGIAQLVRTSNAEAHASMYIDTTVVCSQ